MRYICFLVLFFLVRSGLAQTQSELPFVEHLINKGYYKEVLHLIENDHFNDTPNQRDSLSYYKGWAHYSLKNLEQSTRSLLEVGEHSPFYYKSRFFAGYNQTFLGHYDESREILGQLNNHNERFSSLVNFELGGIDMLQGDWLQAEDKFQKADPNVATINQQIIALTKICRDQAVHRSKSPFLAGVLSGIVPGSGKIYAGKTGEGIASMIATVGFGLITWENYHKLGFSHAKTILFGTIFAATYISNIYGSVISVKIIENEYKDALHNQILFQLHIPLRNFFEL